ncbi:glycosyl transferase family 90-domain-containing protein [Mycena capillaripes]|nr:glycosyl transferase family 90-domain-containing protein [Mycena capillaripes]
MAYPNPESTIARPLLSLTTSAHPSASASYGARRRQRRLRFLLLLGATSIVVVFLSTYVYFGPSAGLPIPERLAGYSRPPTGGGGGGGSGWSGWGPWGQPGAGNAPPPAHGGAGEHPHGAPMPGKPPPVDGLPPLDSSSSSSPLSSPSNTDYSISAESAVDALLSVQPSTLPSARAYYTLRTSRPPPTGFDAFFAFAQERKCLVGSYEGVWRDFAPFWKVEMGVAAKRQKESGRTSGMEGRGWFRERVNKVEQRFMSDGDSHGIAALAIRDGKAHKPEQQASYFDGDWERTINKFAASLPPMTVLVNGRDEPRVVFDVGPFFEEGARLGNSTHRPNPLQPRPPRTAAFFSDAPSGRDQVCRPARGWARRRMLAVILLSASSAEFTTDLVPVLSMTKLADASTVAEGGGSCFADVLVPGEFFYRTSWWAGKFEYPNNVKWEDKKEVLYWRGKSNGGHIRGTNYRSFPRFRLMDLAALPENREKGLFDVRITQWHEWHCTDDCDAEPIKSAYNITENKAPAEEAYQYKYLLDVDGNTFSGRYLGLMRSGGWCLRCSTAFAEFFTPWLVPYEHFIPVRPDLADLPAKIEWARANDGEARRIQEAGRVFAERVLTDAQNDCYWFAVLLEWGALWGEG